MRTASFDRLAAWSAVLVALGGIVYATLFVVVVEGGPEWVRQLWFATLMAGGLATLPVIVALYFRLREIDWGLALLALLLSLGGAFGGVLHGAYELGASTAPAGAAYHPGPEAVAKGVLRYAVAGLSLLILARLLQRDRSSPRALPALGYAAGACLLFTYAGRLAGFVEPGSYAGLTVPLAYGLLLHPAWYLLLARTLLRDAATAVVPPVVEIPARTRLAGHAPAARSTVRG